MLKRTTADDSGNRSLRIFFLFCFSVFLLVVISLSIRLFILYRESSFDGKHRYTLEVMHSDKQLDIVTFEPISKSVSIFNFKSKSGMDVFSDQNGIPVDGKILDGRGIIQKDNLVNRLYKYMLRVNSGSNVNSLDIARLILFIYGVDKNNIKVEIINDISLQSNLLDEAFLDHELVDENKTIAIVNAAGEPGLASRTEKVLNRLGANVVSVTTESNIEKESRIEYLDVESYTLSKIVALSNFPSVTMDEEGISDILIVLGEDSIDTPED